MSQDDHPAAEDAMAVMHEADTHSDFDSKRSCVEVGVWGAGQGGGLGAAVHGVHSGQLESGGSRGLHAGLHPACSALPPPQVSPSTP